MPPKEGEKYKFNGYDGRGNKQWKIVKVKDISGESVEGPPSSNWFNSLSTVEPKKSGPRTQAAHIFEALEEKEK